MILNINIPTKGRPEKLFRCLQSIDFSGDYRIFIHCFRKFDDLPSTWPDNVKGHIYEVVEDKDILTIESHNRVCKHGGHFMGLSDDIEFHSGALDKAVEVLESELDSNGIVDFRVSNMDAPDGCFMMIGDSFIEKFPERTPYFPDYKFMFASAELRDYAKSIDRFFKCEEAKLAHYHPSATGKPDDTHTRIRTKGIIQNDNDLYTKRQKAGLIWSHMSKGQKSSL